MRELQAETSNLQSEEEHLRTQWTNCVEACEEKLAFVQRIELKIAEFERSLSLEEDVISMTNKSLNNLDEVYKVRF